MIKDQLISLRNHLDSGLITPDEFVDQVNAVYSSIKTSMSIEEKATALDKIIDCFVENHSIDELSSDDDEYTTPNTTYIDDDASQYIFEAVVSSILGNDARDGIWNNFYNKTYESA